MTRKELKVLSFNDQDRIFHRIFSEPIFSQLPKSEESLRPTFSTNDPDNIDEYFLCSKWHLAFIDELKKDDVIKLASLLPNLYLSNFHKEYPNFYNFYTLRVIDVQNTAHTIEFLIVIDSSEARIRNLL